MPATTRRTPETATKTGRSKKATATARARSTETTAPTATTCDEKPKRKKEVTVKSPELVVVGPVAEIPQTPTIVYESGTRLSRIGNAFEVTLTGAGDLVVRYQDRSRRFGPNMKVVVVSNPGRGESVVVADLALDGAMHEGRIQLDPEIGAIALAFAGNGRWDSNESRNYFVNLKP